jgi:hypothetical protein
MAVSATVRKTLAQKAKGTKYTTAQLVKVFSRGQGAFLSSGSRPGMTMQRWAYARVNSFLRGSRKHDLDLRRTRRKSAAKKKTRTKRRKK